MMPHSIRRVQLQRARRLALAVLAACVALFAAPGLPAARADVTPVQLADALMSYDALYVATGTGKWETDPTLDYLRKAMEGQKLPVYVMVLPKSKDLPDPASQDEMLKKVAGVVGRSGTYVLLTGTSLRVHSTSLSPATTAKLVEQATTQGGTNRLKVMGNLIKAAGTAPQETSAPGRAANGGRYIPPVKKDDSGSTGLVLIVVGVLVVAALAAGGFFLLRRRKQSGSNPAKPNGAAKPNDPAKPGAPAAAKPGNTQPNTAQPNTAQPGAAQPANGRSGG
ncbi:MAG: LPXTG cell wall anchor domain-containing protein, partial [Spirillospora sp.]